jgi:hypothetical protein
MKQYGSMIDDEVPAGSVGSTTGTTTANVINIVPYYSNATARGWVPAPVCTQPGVIVKCEG